MRSKKAIYNVASSLLLQLIIVICGFIVPKLVIGHFGSEVNGLVTSITQFLGYITLLEAGIGPVVKSALYKPIAKKDHKEIENVLSASERFFRTLALIFIGYMVLLCIFYPIIVENNFSYLYTSSLFVILSISTFMEYFFGITYSLYLQANQKNYIITIIKIITYIINVILTIILIKLKCSIHVVKLVSCLIFILRPITLNIYMKKKYNLNIKNGDKNYKLSQRWDSLAQHVAYVVHKHTDVAVLSLFGNLFVVSIYSVYNMVVTGINKIVVAFSNGISSSFGDMIARGEHDNLNKKFHIYEIIYFTICTILYSCTIILITPFLTVYTRNFTDTNYIQPTFGVLIVLSEFIYAVRAPYSSLTISAGHFKETKVGAWIECIINIVCSVVLVIKYGLVGVAIGTVAAMSFRTIEYMYHSNKYILNRSMLISIKKILLIVVETLLIIYACNYLPYVQNTSYLNWAINGLMVFCVASVITIVINLVFYAKEYKELIKMLKGIVKRGKKK